MADVKLVGLRVIGARDVGAPVQDGEIRAWALSTPEATLVQVASDASEEALILGLLGSLSAVAAQSSLFSRVVLVTWSDGDVGTFPFLDMRMMRHVSDDDLGDVLEAWPWRLHVAEERSRGERQGVLVDFPLWAHVWHLDAGFVAEDWCDEFGVDGGLGSVMGAWGMEVPELPDGWVPSGEDWRLAAVAHAEAVGVRLLGQQLCEGVVSDWVDPKLV